MIIAWYPGGGGNRFYQWLIKSQQVFESNKIYDYDNPFQVNSNRYPGRFSGQINTPTVFTHCINYDLITQTWPGHKQIYILQVDLYKSLRRQWHLIETTVNANQHPVGGPFSAIAWHTDYYNEYPKQSKDFIPVDATTFPEFYNMIQQELDSVVCPEFDFALEMFKLHGKNAPILDLYQERYEQR